MDSKTNVQELKERVREFCEERDWDQFHSGKELAITTIIECAELLEHFRYKTEKECEELFDSPKTRNEICKKRDLQGTRRHPLLHLEDGSKIQH